MEEDVTISDTIKLSDNTMNNNICFIAGAKEPKEVLRLEPNGKIVWTLNDEQIEIKDKEMLCLALLDLVNQLSHFRYDMSKIDADLYKRYQQFLESERKE